jgi:hypothetical protein
MTGSPSFARQACLDVCCVSHNQARDTTILQHEPTRWVKGAHRLESSGVDHFNVESKRFGFV